MPIYLNEPTWNKTTNFSFKLVAFISARGINWKRERLKIKYRWLAIAVLVISAIRLIFVDMSGINIGYRVLVFLLLAIISITVSVLYSKHFKKEKE